MIRNDYRHARILLRSSVKDMSGHVRLERRTLSGSMRFSVSGAGSADNLRALLMRKGRGGWTGMQMGALHIDSRGQAGLTWTFDPRNIDGFALEDYPVVAIARLKSGQAELILSGFLNGSAEVEWAQIASAIRAMYRRPEQAPQMPQAAAEPEPEPEPVGGLPEVSEAEAENDAQEQTEVQEIAPQAAQEPTEEGNGEIPKAQEPTEDQEPTEAQDVHEEAPGPAAALLALDIEVPWPEAVEPLRPLFERLPACAPFPADGYTFVCAPLPGGGQAHSLVGVRVEDERPTSVCYGIPGTFAPEPPVGLDGYMWRGSGVNGWWVIFVDALTGEEVPE